MSDKAKISNALKQGAGKVPIAYGYTKRPMPYIIFNLIDNRGLRLSGKRHSKSTRWQVDVYSLSPKDVDADTLLSELQDALEDNRLITSEWIEIAETDAKTEQTNWRYMLEVLVDG